jgi:hypothetical protein
VAHVGGNELGEFKLLSPDPAVWHTVDLRVVLVPASSPSIDAVASPATNPALAWTTNQATREGRDAWVRAVDDEVKRMTAPWGAPFRPLERARDIFQLLRGQRAATGDGERALVATFSSSRRRHWVGVSIVTASDDESPEPLAAYVLADRYEVRTNVVTPEGRGQERADPARFPRLSAWDVGSGPGSFGGCHDDVNRPLYLFSPGCIDYWTRCEARPIEETSPGIGRCYIEITTTDPPMCDRARGWVEPFDEDGVRRPRVNGKGEHVCEALPVAAAVMDACIHDETCANCGSGWCVSEVRPQALICPNTPAKVLRWVGGVLPEGGSFRVTCSEPRDP